MTEPPISTASPGAARWTARRPPAPTDRGHPRTRPRPPPRAGGSPWRRRWRRRRPGRRRRDRAPRSSGRRRMLAAMLVGSPCSSSGGVPRSTLRRFGPLPVNWGPSRATRRWATLVARCSSSTVWSPAAQRSPTRRIAAPMRSTTRVSGAVPALKEVSTMTHAPASSSATRRDTRRRTRPAGMVAGPAALWRPGVPALVTTAPRSRGSTNQSALPRVAGSRPVRT
jgi:hypothetical protein